MAFNSLPLSLGVVVVVGGATVDGPATWGVVVIGGKILDFVVTVVVCCYSIDSSCFC